MTIAIATSPLGRWTQRLQACPPAAWLALQAAALWVHWRWAASRLADGSDDPLGLVAMVALAWAVWRLAPALRRDPTPGWLALALGMSVAATLAVFVAPPLVGALWAALALACGLRAFLPPGRPMLPLAGLAVLALPVVSSLQFYAGYPLRVATAELSGRLLQLAGWAAARTGSAMEVEGRLVIVDAPCSGVQMAWMAYFTACAAALAVGLSDGRFARRLPALGLVVLAGNVVRNTVLVAAEARGMATPALHEGVGLAVLGAVCATVAMLVIRGGHDARA